MFSVDTMLFDMAVVRAEEKLDALLPPEILEATTIKNLGKQEVSRPQTRVKHVQIRKGIEVTM